jgi:hypothetical protein
MKVKAELSGDKLTYDFEGSEKEFKTFMGTIKVNFTQNKSNP